MRRYRKWVLTLGIMATAPSVAMAGPFPSLFKPREAPPAAGARDAAAQVDNQKVAEDIANALRAARLTGFDIEIEYNDGVATLSGMIADPRQHAQATKAVSKVRGVNRVDNRLELMDDAAAKSLRSPVQQADLRSAGRPSSRGVQQTSHTGLLADPSGGARQAEAQGNQQMAEQIAAALGAADFKGFDIQIQYRNGTALLAGQVGSAEQHARATRVVSSVPGVQQVDNQLQFPGRPAPGGPGVNPYAQPGMSQSPYQPAAYQPGPMGPGTMPPPPGHPGMAPPPGYGHPAATASHTIYNMPHVPEHAWPTYAAYPNYAQVAYPKEYSASAWPYIGPFYPYPQVPLGWRQAQLEWDDGYWHLNFRPRTERWWWFLNPKNW
jgi:osmotically-inducible protein OsmY